MAGRVIQQMEVEEGEQPIARPELAGRRSLARRSLLELREKFVCTKRIIIASIILLIILSVVVVERRVDTHAEEMRGNVIVEGGTPFSVLHYNILADYLANNGNPWFLLPLDFDQSFRQQLVEKFLTKIDGKYVYNIENCFGELLPADQCEQVKAYQYLFKWDRRGPQLLDTVRRMDADIFSLVELDRYDEFVEAFPEYGSTFAKRPRKPSIDGCSIFWRHRRFEPVGEPIHQFFKEFDPGHYEDPDYKWSNDRVMTAIALRERGTEQVIIVVSLHLMKGPEIKENDPVRMLEVSQMMHHVSCLKDKHGAVGMVILGDFNSKPGSWTHVFMSDGWETCQKPDWDIQDVFKKTRANDPGACTTRTKARKFWVDYIFFSQRTLRQLEAPTVAACPDEPMPSEQHPSDHLPLKATFAFEAGARVPFKRCVG